MAKPKRQDELLFHAAGTTINGSKRHFSVYKHGAAVLVRMAGRPAPHLCPARVQTEEQITREIQLVFDVTELTTTRPT
jgi:hypothetical protein